ncbi:MAG: T9SS type A sorting domain-containing protein [Bacteroidia bacterium]
MTRQYIIFLCSFLFTVQIGLSQQWFEMIQNPDATLPEVQVAAEQYFAEHGTGKGTGWKQYKRWEYMASLQQKEDGSLPTAEETLAEVTRFAANHPSNKRNSSQGNWRELGPNSLPGNGTGQPNGIGRVNCITFHPANADIVYAGTPSGGIWQSNNKGISWTKISVGLPRLGVSSIVIDPTNTNIIYIGTGDRDAGDTPGYGVWRSIDAGQTWQSRKIGMGNRVVNEIIMHPNNPDIMIAATYQRIYRTIDGGASWTLSYSGYNCKDLAFHPNKPDVVYAGGEIFLKSGNNGASFTQITNGLPALGTVRMAIGVSPNQPDWVYLLLAGSGASGFMGMYRSQNEGTSFTAQSTTPNILGYDTNGGWGNQGWYDLCIAVDRSDANIVYTGGINVWKTTDGGLSWNIMTHWFGAGGKPAVHADDHCLEWSPHDGALWLGNDGGVYLSNSIGSLWTQRSQGMGIAQVYKMGQSASNPDLVINGYQDNGTAIYRGGSWSTEIGGDGMECIIDADDPTVMYGALYYGDIRRSVDGGNSFITIASAGTNGINESGAWVTPYMLHPDNTNTMFIGYRNVWRSTNVKENPGSLISWTKISNLNVNYNLTDLNISPVDSQLMMVSESGGNDRLHVSENVLAANPTWRKVTLPLAGYTPKDIEFHPTQRNTVWIALGNDIYRSNDLGMTWTLISGTLPGISLNTIIADAESPVEALYVGMADGVYYLDNSIADWVKYSDNLPPARITELEIFYDKICGDALLRAATYGRGLWESDLRDPGTEAPFACFEANQQNICAGSVVSFSDQSSYGPSSWEWQVSPANQVSYINGTSNTSVSPSIQFGVAGVYTVSLIVSNAQGRDTLTKTDYIAVGDGVMSLPYAMDFEGATLCSSASNCGTAVCGLPGGWINTTNGEGDDVDWRIHAGATPSSSTGPSRDANSGVATGRYIYLEGSGGCTFQTASLESPCLDLRAIGNPVFLFHMHMYGSRIGDLHVDIFHNGSWTNDIITAISGNKGNSWIQQSVDLSSYTGSVIRLRIRGVTGGGYDTDMALDNLQLTGVSLATEVVNFEGNYIQGKGNKLDWEAENITPGEIFAMQRQNAETGDFETIGEQAVTTADRYTWLDPKPMVGPNYYRLAVFTIDGNWEYFETIEVVADADLLGVNFFPNPFSENLNIRITSNDFEDIPVEVRDLQGRLITKKIVVPSARTSTTSLELASLVPGVYMVIVRNKGYRIIKQ